jgi:AraC-like DNA-binding protein
MRTDRAPYSTTLYLWKGVSAMFYTSFITPFHSHNTLQLVFTLREPFRFRTPDTSWQRLETLVIKEDCIHRLDTDGSVHLIIYVDAASATAQAIRDRYLKQCDFFSPDGQLLHRLRPGELQQCLLAADRNSFEDIVHRILAMLTGKTALVTGETPSVAGDSASVAGGMAPTAGEMMPMDGEMMPMDHRVEDVIRLLIGEPETATIHDLAGRVFLSESRLRSLFARTTGVSLHKYIIIQRISLAMGMMMNGATIAEAAAGSGFTDSSHFHRMLIQTFRISPSKFMRDNSKRHIHRSGDSPLRLITRQYDERSWDVERIIAR